MYSLKSGDKLLSLETPKIMGIVNVTPDSFSDGGQFAAFERACRHVDDMIANGVDIIDIGGESTRPGAVDVDLTTELERVVPLISYVAEHHDVWISIDTSKAKVMQEAVAAGAHLINDVRALQAEGALECAAKLKVPVCLMHMQGQPRTMQASPQYQNVVKDVSQFFEQRVQVCVDAGIAREQLIIDPGFGFGKTLEHNYQMLAQLDQFAQLNLPLLAGLSRKSMFGQLLNREVEERMPASIAGALLCMQNGAHIIRVHDVKETVDVLKVWQYTKQYC